MDPYRFFSVFLLLILLSGVLEGSLHAQTSGQIFKPATGDGRLILDPNGDGFVSSGTAGFSSNVDYGPASEIGFHPLPPLYPEVKGDQRTGGAHTDLLGVEGGVGGHSDAGGFLYSDGTNLLFRARIMNQSNASKGYSFLFDTNGNGRPNYEVIMRTGGGSKGISILNEDGNTIETINNLDGHFQKSLAGVHDGDQTYYYDWYVPWNDMPFGTGQDFRSVVLTITSAVGSYLSTPKVIADIGGIDDKEFRNADIAVRTILGSMPARRGTDLVQDGSGLGNVMTSRPHINAPIFAGSSSVSGTSIEADGTSITLNVYNGSGSFQESFSTSVSNNTWTIDDGSLGNALVGGYLVGAVADATGKSASNESIRRDVIGVNTVIVCTPSPTNLNDQQGGPNSSLAGDVEGLPSGTYSDGDLTIRGYDLAGALKWSTLDTDYSEPAVRRADFDVFNQTGNKITFDIKLNPVVNGYFKDNDFLVTAQLQNPFQCESDFEPFADGDVVAVTEPPVITPDLIYDGENKVSGTVPADDAEISIYVNGVFDGSVYASGNNWEYVRGTSFSAGDVIFARANSASAALSDNSNSVVVLNAISGESEAPVITLPEKGAYESGDVLIFGYSIEDPGTNIRIYTHPGDDIIGAGTTNAFGNFTIELESALSANDQIKATAAAEGKQESSFSNIVTVISAVSQLPSAPTVNGGNDVVAGTTSISVSGSGTRTLYADGEEIASGSQAGFSVDAEYIQVGVELTATATNSSGTSELSDPVYVIPAPAASLSLFANPAQTVAGQNSEIIATVFDTFGNIVTSGQNINFDIISGNGQFEGSPNNVGINFLGQASVVYETANSVETSTIGAELSSNSSIDESVEIKTIAGSATQISSLTIVDSSIDLNGSTSVTATVLDANDNPVEGVAVSFFSDQTDRATVEGNATTTASGQATATVTGADNEAGAVVITGSISNSDSNVATSDSETVSLTVQAGATSAANSTIVASPVTGVTANDAAESTLTITVRDGSNNILSGVDVHFEITDGTGGTLSAGGWKSDGSGQATATLTSTDANTITVTGYLGSNNSGSQLGTATVGFVAGPATEIVTFTINNSSIDNGEQTAVIATVHDSNGNVVPNVTVSFSSSNSALATVASSTVTTNSSGVAQTVVNGAASGDGSVTITASISSSDSNVSQNDSKTVSLNVGTATMVSAQHSTLTPVSSSITANGSSTQVLTVTARDSDGNAFGSGGDTVTITRSSGTGEITGVTDHDDGTYTAIVTAPTNIGSGVFVAILGGEEVRSGTSSQTAATINFISGPATQISSLTIEDATIDLNGSTNVTATVLDANDNPVSGVPVSFLSDQTDRATVDVSATTDAAGQASATVNGADNEAGAVVITASISDVDANVAASDNETVGLTVQAGAATRLVITGNATQTAGSTQSLTITARDNAGNVVTSYDGERTLTFSGPNESPNSTSPTIINKNGSAIEFGESVLLDFSEGIATIIGSNNGRMTLFKAETVFISAEDGTIDASGSDRLEVSVNTAAAHTIAINSGNNQFATAGSTLSTNPSILVTDEYGNPVSGVSVTFAVASGGGSLADTDPVTTNSNGIATSPAWTLGTTAGTNTLTASTDGLAGSPLTITATGTVGTATQLVFTQQPTNSVSTEEISPAITVEFRDSNDNLVQSSDNVTLSIENNAALNNDGTLSGPIELAASNGVATFSGLSIDKAGNEYTLKAASGLLDNISSSFNINPGSAVAGNTTASVPGGTAGEVTNITITVRDTGGNLLTGQQGNLAISFDEGPNSDATFSSITDNGDGTYSVSYTPTKTGDDIIGITLNGTAINNSPFTSAVDAGSVASFLVQRSNGNGNGNIPEQTAGEEFTIRVTALDGSDNVVTGFTGTVDLSLNQNSFQNGGGTTANFVDGVLSSHAVQINTANTGYQITATQTGETAPTGTSNSFNVVPASGNAIVITTQPAGAASGSELETQPIIEVQDALNNRLTSFTGQITISIYSGDDGTLSGTTEINAVDGVATFTDVVLTGLVSQDYRLRFSGSGLTSANSDVVNVTPGPATRLAITGSSTQTAGTSQNLTITAYDAKGNVATDYDGEKGLTFSGSSAAPNGTNPVVSNKDGSSVDFGSETTITFSNGIATVDGGNNGVMTLYNAGSSVIAVEDIDEIKAAGSDRLTVTVNNGSLESFAFSLAGPQTNGIAFTGTNTLTALDSWGNTVTGFDASADPVTITSSLTGSISGLGSGENHVLNQEPDFTNGVANLTDTMIFTGTTGSGTFTATADGKTGTSGSVTINSGAASQIAINDGDNQTATVGTSVSVNPSVIVQDASDNPVSGVSVTFSVIGGGGSVTEATGTTNSSGIFTVGSWTLGSETGANELTATITGSDPALSTTFSAEGLPVPDLSINDLETNNTTPDITGLSNQPEGTEVTVTLKDADGNDIVDGDGTPVSYNGTVDADGNWSVTITDPLGEGDYETTATVVDDAGTTSSVTGSLTIDTTPPLLTVNETNTNSTTPTITGTSDQPEGSEVTVNLEDSEGNPVLGDDGNPVSYTATVDSDGNWSVDVTNELEFAEYTIEATTTDNAGNTTTSTGTLTIEEDEPELIVSVTNVNVPSGRIGELTTITVTLQDHNGNPIPGSADLLSFGLSGSNGDVELSGITDNGDGTYSISYTPTVNGEDLITISLDGVEIDGSPFTSIVSDEAWQLVFTQSPNASTEAGDPFGTVIVEVRDSGGNGVGGYSGPISIEVTEGTGGPLSTDAELIGATTVNAVNSIATFSGIVMERSGNNYTLTATANEMDSGISDTFNITPGPPWQLVIRERDEQAALIDEFLSTMNLMANAKTQNSTTANNEAQLEGNRIPMYMVILDEFENVTFVEEGDTQVEITTSSSSGRFFLQQTSNDPINLLTISRNQRITNFYYEDPNPGELTVGGRPIPPAGAREILPGETPIVIRKPGRIRATPNDIVSEINMREAIRISLQDDNGQRVYAPDPGVTVTLSSSSTAGQFYSEKSGGSPIESTLISPAESSIVVYYQDRFVGTHTLTMNGSGVPNPTDSVQFTIEQAGTLSTLSVAGPDTLSAGEQGGIYRLVLQDEFQNEIVTDRDLTFDLNLKDGVNTTYYLDEENNNNIQPVDNKQLTIQAGESNVPFYLSQTHAGDKILNAQSSDDEYELSAGKPIHFTADGETIIMAMIGGNGQQERIMQQLAENLKVTITDQYENPITNKEVAFSLQDSPIGATAMELMLDSQNSQSSKNGAAKFSSVPDVRVLTDSMGVAEATFVLGDKSGEYIIQASSSGLEPLEFIVTAITNEYMLHQNYPNPFDNGTTIIYEVPEEADVRIEVYDMIGRRVTILVSDTREAGRYVLDFDANRYGLASGVYIYRMVAKGVGNGSGYSMVRRMVYVK